jgi:GT2 family glycosyltransferase
MTVDVVLLSNCVDRDYYNINVNCIRSLIESESEFSFNIVVIESNSDFTNLGLVYDFTEVVVVIPNEHFNYNKFLNIGLRHTTNKWIVFSNNDVIFHRGWLTEIFNVKKTNPSIQSFCPFDRTSPYLSFEKFNRKPYHFGYRVPLEFVGWCFVIDRTAFQITGNFDEAFDLYFQDNDFAMTMKKHSILHALVPLSFVQHIGGYTTKLVDASKSSKYAGDKFKFERKWHSKFSFKAKLKNIMFKIIRLMTVTKNL